MQDEHRLSISEVLSRYGSKVDELNPSKSIVPVAECAVK